LADRAQAYRPFDGTDAAVADVGEVEIEFQPLGALRAGTTKALTDAIFNYGFADRWELVLQGTAQTLPEGAGPISVSNGAFLKYVLVPGVLQDKTGPSVATEFGRHWQPCRASLVVDLDAIAIRTPTNTVARPISAIEGWIV